MAISLVVLHCKSTPDTSAGVTSLNPFPIDDEVRLLC